jgi:outer membrane lipoprotein-sorting protein
VGAQVEIGVGFFRLAVCHALIERPKDFMRLTKGFASAAPVLFVILCVIFLSGRTALAADDLNSVLSKLDTASAQFHATSADLEWSSTQTDPVPDTDIQKGVVYYQRTGAGFQMGVHIATDNGQPSPKVLVCCTKGSIQLYEKLQNQVTVLSKLSQYADWFRLGFGASGKELAAKWDIKYDGMETVDGIKTAKLELVPKDPTVKEKLPKVILWMDTDHAVSLKQYFDEGSGLSRTCHYTNFKMNQTLPGDAFTFKTDSKTTTVNR